MQVSFPVLLKMYRGIEAEISPLFLWLCSALDLHLKLAQGASKQELDSLPQELAQWLRKQARFVRYNGSDHFTVLGSPTWVFRNNKEENWGSGLEFVAEFENVSGSLNLKFKWLILNCCIGTKFADAKAGGGEVPLLPSEGCGSALPHKLPSIRG